MTTSNENKGLYYILEHFGGGDAVVRKIVGHEEQQGYVIEGGQCACKGYHYRKECRHVDMLTGHPASNPLPFEEAIPIAKKAMKALKKHHPTEEPEFLGDFKNRRDPVRTIHMKISAEPTEDFKRSIRTIFWVKKCAVIIDKVKPEEVKNGLSDEANQSASS